MTREVIEAIAKASFLATPAQVEQLAAVVHAGKRGGSTYLSVIVAHVKDLLPKRGAKPGKRTVAKAIDKVHGELYPAVLKGVTNGDDITDKVKAQRGTFARSSVAELRGFMKRGGDFRKLDAATVTKAMLRKQGRPVPKGTRSERMVTRAADSLEASLERLAKKDPGEAHDRIEKVQATLEAMLAEVIKAEAAERANRKSARKTKAKSKRTVRTVRPSKEQPGLYQ